MPAKSANRRKKSDSQTVRIVIYNDRPFERITNNRPGPISTIRKSAPRHNLFSESYNDAKYELRNKPRVVYPARIGKLDKDERVVFAIFNFVISCLQFTDSAFCADRQQKERPLGERNRFATKRGRLNVVDN